MHSSARQLPLRHLSVRLPWHDSGWTGTICDAPSENSWCMVLKRIREERKVNAEEAVAGQAWAELSESELPACLTERGAALNTSNLPFDEWTETFGTERLTGALLDRLTHHVNILEMNGESFRLAQSRARNLAEAP
jgi:hypothetical protein